MDSGNLFGDGLGGDILQCIKLYMDPTATLGWVSFLIRFCITLEKLLVYLQLWKCLLPIYICLHHKDSYKHGQKPIAMPIWNKRLHLFITVNVQDNISSCYGACKALLPAKIIYAWTKSACGATPCMWIKGGGRGEKVPVKLRESTLSQY